MKTNIVSLVLIPLLVLNCFGSLPTAQAVIPPPDGGYPGGNTAEGQNAMLNLSSGAYNTAVGFLSLVSDNIGGFNTAIGAGTLLANTANNNTATGAGALLSNTKGLFNTANGAFALLGNTTGSGNTAIGEEALRQNIDGGNNVAIGASGSLAVNTTGSANTAIGAAAMANNTIGNFNIALGSNAGLNLTAGDNNIEIGNVGVAGESNTIRIGDPVIHAAIFMAGITTMTPAMPNQMVLVNPASGQLGSADIPSSGVVSTSPENTAVGDQALASNTGGYNTATGFQALFSNTSAENNTAVGADALLSNTGPNNTAVGSGALFSNQGDPASGLGAFNNAVGANSLFFNVDGNSNNALGESALLSNITASDNTAVGDVALANNDSTGAGDGSFNTAVGAGALFSNVDGNSNNAVGVNALGSNTIGVYNNAIGFEALANNINGSSNVAIGDSAGLNVTSASNVICIGASVAGANVSNSCYVGSIFGQTSSGGAAVLINFDGKLGTVVSSQRFKKEIRAMDKTSEALFALKPVTFRYKQEIDEAGTQQFGLVAEDVEKVNPDLVVRDKDGKPYSVRYEQVNAMLLNEFLKEHRTVQELKATVAQQAKQIETLSAGLEKVSAKLQVGESAPQTVRNSQ
jgi:trimeric autotransporter adhesin